MAAVSPAEIVDALLQAIEDSGYSGAYISRGVREHPRRFAVASPENRYLSVWVYIWTLTHGGRPSLPDEYRIQMTSVQLYQMGLFGSSLSKGFLRDRMAMLLFS